MLFSRQKCQIVVKSLIRVVYSCMVAKYLKDFEVVEMKEAYESKIRETREARKAQRQSYVGPIADSDSEPESEGSLYEAPKRKERGKISQEDICKGIKLDQLI